VHVYVDCTGSHPIVFLALTTTNFGSHYNLDVFCSDFRNEFFQRVEVSQVGDSGASLQRRCEQTIDAIFAKYSAPSALQRATEKTEQVKQVMQSNITLALQNVEKLDEIDERARHLEATAQVFHSSANKLERRMCRDYWTVRILVVVVILAIIGIILGVYFGTK